MRLIERLPTAVDNMSPRHPFVRTLSTMPVAPGVAASELAVRSEHSTRGEPATIEEVRRILLLPAGAR